MSGPTSSTHIKPRKLSTSSCTVEATLRHAHTIGLFPVRLTLATSLLDDKEGDDEEVEVERRRLDSEAPAFLPGEGTLATDFVAELSNSGLTSAQAELFADT